MMRVEPTLPIRSNAPNENHNRSLDGRLNVGLQPV